MEIEPRAELLETSLTSSEESDIVRREQSSLLLDSNCSFRFKLVHQATVLNSVYWPTKSSKWDRMGSTNICNFTHPNQILKVLENGKIQEQVQSALHKKIRDAKDSVNCVFVSPSTVVWNWISIITLTWAMFTVLIVPTGLRVR